MRHRPVGLRRGWRRGQGDCRRAPDCVVRLHGAVHGLQACVQVSDITRRLLKDSLAHLHAIISTAHWASESEACKHTMPSALCRSAVEPWHVLGTQAQVGTTL